MQSPCLCRTGAVEWCGADRKRDGVAGVAASDGASAPSVATNALQSGNGRVSVMIPPARAGVSNGLIRSVVVSYDVNDPSLWYKTSYAGPFMAAQPLFTDGCLCQSFTVHTPSDCRHTRAVRFSVH